MSHPRANAAPPRVAPAAHTARNTGKPSSTLPAVAASEVPGVTCADGAATATYRLLHYPDLSRTHMSFLSTAQLKGFTPKARDDTPAKPPTAGIIFTTTLGNHPQRAEMFAQLLGALCGPKWSAQTHDDEGIRLVVRMLNRRVLFDVDGAWYARTEDQHAVLDAYVRRSPLTCDVLEAAATNVLQVPVYHRDVYHPAGRRVVGLHPNNVLQVPSIPCAVPIASPAGVTFQTVTLGQIPSKMDRDRMYGFLTDVLTIPGTEIVALRTNHHGLWFVDVSSWGASSIFLRPTLPLDYTFSQKGKYVLGGGPLVDARPVAVTAASMQQFRLRMTVSVGPILRIHVPS